MPKGSLPRLIAMPHSKKGLRVSDWTILCDFDGTIAFDDVIDKLLQRHGRAGWEKLESDWRDGLIGSRECMREQVALLDMSPEQFHACLESCQIDPAFAPFVAMARQHSIPLRIVSDGLDYAIRTMLVRDGVEDLPVAGNHLRRAGDRRWQLDSPFSAGNCRSGTCKCACVRQAGISGRHTLLIGDGASDFCAAEEVDFVFAKHRLIDHCQSGGLAYQPIRNFGDVLALMPRLLAGEFDPAPVALPLVAQS